MAISPDLRARGLEGASTLPLLVNSPIGTLDVRAVDAAPSTLRARMEAFVHERFRESFDAEVVSFFPQLLGATDSADELHAVIGFRVAAIRPLFLEQYLDVPVETVVSGIAGHRVSRVQILEVGNLATHPPVVAPSFFQAFVVWITSTTPCDWLVFTGTRSVRLLLLRLGVELFDVAVARRDRLREGAGAWGAYYEHQPRVMAVSLAALRPLLRPQIFQPAQLKSWMDRGRELRP